MVVVLLLVVVKIVVPVVLILNILQRCTTEEGFPRKNGLHLSINFGEHQGLKLVKNDFIPSRFRSCFNQEKLKVKTLQRHYNREPLASQFQMYKENVHRLA